MTKKTPPHPVDLHVGARIRLKRKMAGISQMQLADALDITFQQIQKYEAGANRISASKLHTAALVLKVSLAWFFDGLTTPEGERLATAPRDFAPSSPAPLQALMATREGFELTLLLARMPARPRFQVLALIRALGETEDLAATGCPVAG